MFENVVQDKIVFSAKDFKLENADLHIAFGISANFTHPVGILMTSILENNKDIKIAFHIFADGRISEIERSRFAKLTECYNAYISIYYLDNSAFIGLNDAEFTIAAYYRFAIPYQLKDVAEKFLYLDADMAAVNSFKSFLKIDFKGKTACVVEDFRLSHEPDYKPMLTKNNDGYFNSGMMYIDIQKWLRDRVSEKCLELLREVNADPSQKQKYGYEFMCFDQDALNVVLKGNLIHLAPKFNYLCNISLKQNRHLHDVPGDTIIIHYHGFNKPWHEWCFHPLARYFRQYKSISPWHDEPLDTHPSKYRQMRLYAKYFRRKHQLMKAVFWLLKSAVYKYSK